MNREKKKRRIRRKRALSFALLTVLLSVLLFGVSIAGIFVTLHIPDIMAAFSKGYVFRFYTADSPNSSRLRLSYDADFIYRQGNLYLDFTSLSDLCGFSVSGDADQRRYLLDGGKSGASETLTVNLGTTSVVLSGCPVSMGAPSFLSENGSLYLPCDFVDNYFTGITVEADPENDHSIWVTYDLQTGIGLTLHADTECEEVLPPDAPPSGEEQENDQTG